MVKGFLYIALLAINAFILKAQDTDSFKLSSYEGLHFMVGFMENESNDAIFNKQLEQKIFISSNYDCKLLVSFGGLNPVQYLVNQNDVLTINVSTALENFRSEEIRNNLVEITSDYPIAVYAYSSIPRSTDSYAVIPISNWGKEYIAVSLPNDHYNLDSKDSIVDKTPRSSEILIMAAYDNTKVTIIPSSLTRQLKQVGQSYDVILNKGQCYLVQSWQYSRGQGDLTGTVVTSDKPVGVLTGHVRSALLQGFLLQPPDSKDHLVEMLMPTPAWGNTFITIPFGTNPFHGDYFKIVSKDKNAVIDVKTSNDLIKIRFNGSSSQILEGLNEPALWRSSAPVQVAQFMYRTGDTSESFFYDPSIVILPPVEQFVSKIIFNTPDESFKFSEGEKFTSHYVTIAAQPEALADLKLDNILVTGLSEISTQIVAGTNIHWARIELAPGKHNLVSSTGRFAGILYGVGRFDSYAMTLGCSLQNPYSDDNSSPTITVLDLCGFLYGNITDAVTDSSFGIYYAWVQEDSTFNYKWKIDPVASDDKFITFTAEPIDIYKDGKFVIDFWDKSGNHEQYVYIYDAIKLSYPQEIVLPGLDYNDSLCYEIKIQNLGKKSLDYLKVILNGDSRITLVSNPEPESVLKSGDSIILTLCVNPKGNSNSIYGKINLEFGCNIDIEIPFSGDLVALELDTKGVDFGDVQLGKEKCDSVSINNKGNSDVLLTGLEFQDIFVFDTLNILPKVLKAGETWFVNVCFRPDTRKSYSDSIVFLNEYGINKSAEVKGRGIAPLIESLVYDFGKVRVGAEKILENDMTNTGNQEGIITFNEFLLKSHGDDGISSELSSINGLTIPLTKPKILELKFIPADTLDYSIIADYTTNWEFHPELTISVTGKGTIPVIMTQNVNFGNVVVFNDSLMTPEIIFSKGNEKLTVDKIYPSSGDISSFEIDYSILENLIIEENFSFSTAILFKPNRIGFHEMILGVIHDSKPNFSRDTAYITITGNAVVPDFYDVEILLGTKTILACQYTLGSVKIKNNGNMTHLTDLKLVKSNESFFVELMNFVPRFLDKGETAEYPVRIYAERNTGGFVKVIATFFDKDSISDDFEIKPISSKIIIDDILPIKYAAGDSVFITISGKFDFNIDTLTSFYLSLDIKSDHLMLADEIFSLNLDNFGEKTKYNLNISKTRDKLEFFISDDLINIINNVQWSIDLKFLGLLSQQTIGDWNMTVSSDKCYDPADSKLKTILDSVCVFDARHVFVDNDKAHVNIYPNPADDFLKLKTIFPADVSDGRITVSDNLGIAYTLAENFSIQKGTDYLEFDISSLSNGTYMMRFESKILTKNILFVIIR